MKNSLLIRFAWCLIVALSFFSLSAEIWSNSRPLFLRYHNRSYFPIFQNYYPTEFTIEDRLTVDFKQLALGPGDWALWPPNAWTPFESNKNVAFYPSPPSRENWFGTDDRGRDILARLLYGLRYTLTYAVLVWAVCSVLAVGFGTMTGFCGGWMDLLGQRAVEVFSTIPSLFLLIFLLTLFETSLTILVLVSGFLGWTGLSYFIRAEALRLRKLEFVEAAYASGASRLRIMLRHVLPNTLSPLITFTPFMMIANITGLTVLDFLGFGLPPPTPSWGELLSQGQAYFSTAWWLAVFPSLALFAVLFSVTLVGEDIRLRQQSS